VCQLADRKSKARSVIGSEVQGVVTPDITETWNVVRDDRAPGERSLERLDPEWLVAGSCRIDRCTAIEIAHLRFCLGSLQRDTELFGGYFHICSDGHAQRVHRMLGANNAYWKRVLILREQVHLFPCIEQPPNRQHRVFLTHIRIEEDWVATVIDDP